MLEREGYRGCQRIKDAKYRACEVWFLGMGDRKRSREVSREWREPGRMRGRLFDAGKPVGRLDEARVEVVDLVGDFAKAVVLGLCARRNASVNARRCNEERVARRPAARRSSRAS